MYIASNFTTLLQTIKVLETSGDTLEKNCGRIGQLEKFLADAPGIVAKKAHTKLVQVLNKNPGFSTLKAVANILSGTDVNACKIPTEDLPRYKYAPVTTCEVERSFSNYKNILSDRRQNFTPENLEKYVVCNFNS